MEYKQEFSAQVDQVIQADDITINHHHGRPLTMDERRDVNARIRRISEKYGNPTWEVWRLIHCSIGVDSVEQLTIQHRDLVTTLLDLLAENGVLRLELETRRMNQRLEAANTPDDSLPQLQSTKQDPPIDLQHHSENDKIEPSKPWYSVFFQLGYYCAVVIGMIIAFCVMSYFKL